MKAVMFDDFGGPEVLREAEVGIPEPGPGQVRIRVHAAGVNPIDWKIRRGMMRPHLPPKLPSIPGIEAAGVVEAVGSEVTGFAPGDEVFGWSNGGAYCEQALLAVFAPKPRELSFEQAAALPLAGETAERGLRFLKVGDGDTVLIHGASGAVGSYAVQLAVARGARVIGTASRSNQDYLASLGAEPLVYGDDLVDRVRAISPDGVDAVFDVAGRGVLGESIELLRGTGDRIVTLADSEGSKKYGVKYSGGPGDSIQSPELLADLAGQAARGELKIAIARTYPLPEAAAAQRESETGHGRGKLMIVVA